MATKTFLLILAFLSVTLTLIHSCQLKYGYVCDPHQPRACRGKCNIQATSRGMRCLCMAEYTFYGWNSPYNYRNYASYPGQYQRAQYRGPGAPKLKAKKNKPAQNAPFGEANIERQTELLTSMIRLQRIMS